MIFIILILLGILQVNCVDKTLMSMLKNSPDLIDTNDSDNNCQFKLSSDLLNAGLFKKNENVSVYAGNGFSYDIGCSVSDTQIKNGDKYYMIHLIIYGPNSRVAKAWREQYQIGKNIVISRNVSFHSLGVNNIVCVIDKYNSLTNNFTRICQKNNKINVKERLDDANSTNLIKLLSSKYNAIKHAQLLKQKQQEQQQKNWEINFQFFTSRKENFDDLKNKNSILKVLKSDFLNKTSAFTLMSTTASTATIENHTNINIYNENLLTSNISTWFNPNNNLTEFNFNLSSMEFNIENRKLIINQQTNLNNFNLTNAKKQILQPLTVVFILVIIFSASIGTLVYLTYFQKSNHDYQSVKVVNNLEMDVESNSNHSPKNLKNVLNSDDSSVDADECPSPIKEESSFSAESHEWNKLNK